MLQNIIIDSGFWYALYSPRDQYHLKAIELFQVIEEFNKIVPWPTLYEVINSRFVKNKQFLDFDKILKHPKTIKVSDKSYRENTLSKLFISKPRYSLVDNIIRNMLEDVNLKIDAIVTFNEKDFEDICYAKSIEILFD